MAMKMKIDSDAREQLMKAEGILQTITRPYGKDLNVFLDEKRASLISNHAPNVVDAIIAQEIEYLLTCAVYQASDVIKLLRSVRELDQGRDMTDGRNNPE